MSRCEGVSGSEDFLSFFQNQWPDSLQDADPLTDTAARRHICLEMLPEVPTPPLLSNFVTVNSPPPILSCTGTWLSRYVPWREVKGSRTRERRGEKTGWGLLGWEKGLYRKSISLFPFPHVGQGHTPPTPGFLHTTSVFQEILWFCDWYALFWLYTCQSVFFIH